MTNESRVKQICDHIVTDRNNIWDAFDQGRWAYAAGHPKTMNSHASWHVNFSDWNRGYDAEAREFPR